MPMLAKRRAWLSAKRASLARVFPAGFLAQQNLLNKRLGLMRLSRRFCLPDAYRKNKFVEMSAGFLALAPGGTTQANFGVGFEETLSPEDSTASFLEKGHAEV